MSMFELKPLKAHKDHNKSQCCGNGQVDNVVMPPKNKIVREDSFRSKPQLNMSNDMYRVTLDIKRRHIHKLRSFINELD